MFSSPRTGWARYIIRLSPYLPFGRKRGQSRNKGRNKAGKVKGRQILGIKSSKFFYFLFPESFLSSFSMKSLFSGLKRWIIFSPVPLLPTECCRGDPLWSPISRKFDFDVALSPCQGLDFSSSFVIYCYNIHPIHGLVRGYIDE